ncbi:MAG: MOSC domain-containing protein, partial [Tardiphaga sp.]
MTEAFEHPAGSIAATKAGGATQWRGKLLHIHVAPSASYEMEERQEAECVAGRGIVGDRYYLGTGTYSPKPDVREVTLIEQEALDALSRNDPPLQDGAITLEPRDHRRNLTVIG